MGLLEQVTLSGTDSKDKNISKYFYNNAGVQIKMYTGMSSENDTSYLTSKTVNSKDSKKNVSKSYEYDNMGRILRAVTNDLTTTYSYDDLGRKSEEVEGKDGYSTFKGFFYEGVSQYTRQQIVGINNLLMYSYTSYEYDGEMRLTKVKETGEETVSYTYDRNGNKKSETLANGVVSTYDYNNANRIVKLVNKKGNSTISSYEYSYYLDGSDACKKTTENGIIETTEYEYDGLKRLTNEAVKKGSNTDTYSYEYDDYGNRSKMTATGTEDYVTEYNYNNAQGNYTALLQKEVKTVEGEENPLDLNSNVKQTVYTYDANGNQITKTAEGKTETNTYNGLNQLIGFTDGETTASYKYNASGLRYEKTVNGETINHVWDGNQQIVADVIDNQFYEADCYIRGTNLVAKYNYWNGDKSEYTYYTQNAHGDVVNLTDKDGKVTKSYRYDAFGIEKNIDENDTNAFRYCGEYFDKETATVYLRARYYNPSTGRFINRDSYLGKRSDPLSLNLYTYCRNNPIRYIDPSGHSYATLPNGDKMSINSASDAKKFEEKKAKMKKGAPGCSHGECSIDGVLVVAREGKKNDDKRFNAIITVYSPDGAETSFVGSTLPDDLNYKNSDGEQSVVVDEGIYHIQIGNGTHAGGQFYNVLTLEGSWYLPGTNYTDSGIIHSDDRANGILIHRAENGESSLPWSEGCITIEESADSTANIDEFVKLVGSSATLIIKRE
ncbi:MAG: RHS repeat domain-containing protein [Oscillospiraceae bacterium]